MKNPPSERVKGYVRAIRASMDEADWELTLLEKLAESLASQEASGSAPAAEFLHDEWWGLAEKGWVNYHALAAAYDDPSHARGPIEGCRAKTCKFFVDARRGLIRAYPGPVAEKDSPTADGGRESEPVGVGMRLPRPAGDFSCTCGAVPNILVGVHQTSDGIIHHRDKPCHSPFSACSDATDACGFAWGGVHHLHECARPKGHDLPHRCERLGSQIAQSGLVCDSTWWANESSVTPFGGSAGDVTHDPYIPAFKRALTALALELPGPVYDDFKERAMAVVEAYERLAAGSAERELLADFASQVRATLSCKACSAVLPHHNGLRFALDAYDEAYGSQQTEGDE